MMSLALKTQRRYHIVDLCRPTYPSHSMIGSHSVIMLVRLRCTTLGKVIVASSQSDELLRLIEFANARSGQSQFLTSPMPAQPLAFNLSLDDDRDDNDNATQRLEDNDARLMEMLAAQAAHREDGSAAGDEEAIAADKKLSDTEKKAMLQKSLHNAASNGDVDQVGRVLQGPARKYVDINGQDEEGTAPIIYASCFVSSCMRSLC